MKKTVFSLIFLALLLGRCTKFIFVNDEILRSEQYAYPFTYYVTEQDTTDFYFSTVNTRYRKGDAYISRNVNGINIYGNGLKIHLADTSWHTGRYIFHNPMVQGQVSEQVDYMKKGFKYTTDSSGYLQIIRIDTAMDGSLYIEGIFEGTVADTTSSALIFNGHMMLTDH